MPVTAIVTMEGLEVSILLAGSAQTAPTVEDDVSRRRRSRGQCHRCYCRRHRHLPQTAPQMHSW